MTVKEIFSKGFFVQLTIFVILHTVRVLAGKAIVSTTDDEWYMRNTATPDLGWHVFSQIAILAYAFIASFIARFGKGYRIFSITYVILAISYVLALLALGKL